MARVKLIRDTRVAYKAGETIDVSAELLKVLVSTGSAEPVPEVKKAVPVKAAKKSTRK